LSDNIKLIECLTTWQGEGPDTGKRMLLCRFKYCNKKCPWCDTLVKMRSSQETEVTIESLQKIINKEQVGLMITGGEPTLGRHIGDTIRLLSKLNYSIANVETNGFDLINLCDSTLISSIANVEKIKYIYSPKIFNSTNLEKEIYQTKLFSKYFNIFFKVVYEDRIEINKYLKFLSTLDIHQKVYLMPQGIDREELIRNAPKVFDIAEKYHFNFTSRTHLMFNFI